MQKTLRGFSDGKSGAAAELTRTMISVQRLTNARHHLATGHHLPAAERRHAERQPVADDQQLGYASADWTPC